jgi:5-methylcytosine-specific restriction endonuclease McrA
MNSLAPLTDASLHSELKRLVGSSNTLTAQLLAHLGEVEARGIHRERACSSLYTYCVYELRMSEDEAQRRCRAARLARQFPILLEMLAEASLHLTGLLLIGPHLTEQNQAELLARARFRSKREIERLVAEIAPSGDVPSRIVPLYRAGAGGSVVAPLGDEAAGLPAQRRCSWAAYVGALAGAVREMEAGLGSGQAPPRVWDEAAGDETMQVVTGAARDLESGARTPAVDIRHGASTSVVAGEAERASGQRGAEVRYKVQFTADQAYVDLLEEARDLLQHQLPARDLVEVQRRALQLLVQRLRHRKCADSARVGRRAAAPSGEPQPQSKAAQARPPALNSATGARRSATKPAKLGRYIPAEVRRSVWRRDEARCSYVDARGQRCREQAGLEFHHRHPHGKGGPASIENLALRCRSHNDLAAEQDFGRDLMREKRTRKARRTEPIRAGAGL